jgi:hypothetical protein
MWMAMVLMKRSLAVVLSRIRCGAHRGELDAERRELVRRQQREKALGRAQQPDYLAREHQGIVRGHGPEVLVDALLGFEGQLAQAFADVLGDRNRSVLRQRDRDPARALVATGLDQAQHATVRGQLPAPMLGDGALQLGIAFGEPRHHEVVHEGLGRSFQRLPLVGVGQPDGPVELLRGPYNGDGERQVLAEAVGDRCPLSDLGRDQLGLVPEDEANDALSFRERREVFRRGLRGRNGSLPRSRKLSTGRCLAGSPSGVGSGVERIGRSANYRAGEGIRTLDVNLGKVALYH